jgi:hypothetical protein
MNKRKSILIGIALFLISGTVFAFTFPPRVSWDTAALKPASIAPGSTASFQFTLTNTGFLPIPATNQLRIVAEGNIAPFITFTQPTFPPVFKRGNQVTIQVHVSAPASTPLSVKTGELVLKRFIKIKVGKVTKEIVLDVWRADALPVELTFSSFFIPPAPNKTLDESTIEGVDSNANGVPDRVDRFIAFTAPDSEKKRVAMTLSAKAQQDFFIDYLDHLGEDPNDAVVVARVRGMADVRGKTGDCLMYIFGANESFKIPGVREKFEAYSKNGREIQALYMDTPERIRAFWQSEKPLVATSYKGVPDEQAKQQCLDLGFDPDTLLN